MQGRVRLRPGFRQASEEDRSVGRLGGRSAVCASMSARAGMLDQRSWIPRLGRPDNHAHTAVRYRRTVLLLS